MTEQVTVFGKRILLAEDDRAVRESLKLMLNLDQHIVTEASNGREALSLFSPEQFDLIITDYLMPEMQGDELARNIKRIAPGRPVLMVTAYLEKLLASDHSADSVLAKPIDLDGLRRAIACRLQTLPPSSPGDELPGESAPLSPQKLRARAATTSKVLSEILGYDSDTAFLRGWGIND
jgi:CheY-like chemotaxis protein